MAFFANADSAMAAAVNGEMVDGVVLAIDFEHGQITYKKSGGNIAVLRGTITLLVDLHAIAPITIVDGSQATATPEPAIEPPPTLLPATPVAPATTDPVIPTISPELQAKMTKLVELTNAQQTADPGSTWSAADELSKLLREQYASTSPTVVVDVMPLSSSASADDIALQTVVVAETVHNEGFPNGADVDEDEGISIDTSLDSSFDYPFDADKQ